MKLLPLLVAGGAGAAALLIGTRRARASSSRSPEQDGGYFAPPQPAPSPSSGPDPRDTGSSGGRLTLKTTKYHPNDAKTAAQKKMEGGIHGAAVWRGKKAVDPATGKRPVLYSLDDALAGRAPYCSLAGDPEVWPFGQRLEIDAWPGVVFRVVDTGGNFKGANKKYHIPGTEPIDVCVDTKKTPVPTTTGARIAAGDNFEGGTQVAVSNLRGQNVTMVGASDGASARSGYSIIGGDCGPLVDCIARGEEFAQAQAAFTDNDREALARAVESSTPKGSVYEKQAVAWACRNRAALLGVSIHQLLAPEGVYGPRGEGGRDFVSTAREPQPGDVSSQVAAVVLGLGQEHDPTSGATDFWNPGQQRRAQVAAHVFGGDASRVAGEDEVREALGACGLRVCGIVGELELLS